MALGRKLMAPRAVVRWLPVTGASHDRLDVAGEALHVPGIGARWGPIEFTAAAVCTVGEAVEQRVRQLWDARELPLAAMLDSVGSGATESLAEYVNDVLCQEGLARGLRVTNRISPGYRSWDVAEQQALLRLCPAFPIGITLNDACFMTPGKSISFLVGAGPHARVDDYFSQCARCWMTDCAFRRAPLVRAVRMGGLERAPQAPRRSERPGKPGALSNDTASRRGSSR
ncbi:MAG: vitamin B12 dependent-methionine synthase activation domain-containing protein [Candidatus Rokuibacteriota bacterium]